MKYVLQIGVVIVFCVAALCGCTKNDLQANDVTVSPTPADSITTVKTAEELLAFFDAGGPTAVLANSISLGNAMLRLTAARGAISIEGAGYTVAGESDCVIRMEEGCTLVLNHITIEGKKDGMGFLGAVQIGGQNTVIRGNGNALHANAQVKILPESSITFESADGSGVLCAGLEIGENAEVSCIAREQGINTSREDLILCAGSSLHAQAGGYNAVKIGGALRMFDGAAITVTNSGEFHGAEVGELAIDGDVTLNMTGGAKGVGLFVVDLYDDFSVYGACKPEMRFENGKGSVTFLGDRPAS